MTSRQRRAAEDSHAPTRQTLIDATRRLVASGPADAVTSRAIAALAGANLGAVTYYFGSKEHLIAKCFVDTATELLQSAIAVLGSDLDPTDKMTQTIALLNQLLSDQREHVLTYLRALTAAPSDTEIASQLQLLHHDIAALLSEQIERQQAAEQLPDWIRPAEMAQLIIAVVHGTLIAAAVDPDHADPNAISSQLALLLMAVRTSST